MDIRVETEEEQSCLEVGDVIFIKDCFAIVCQETLDYTARRINNGHRITGLYGTLKKLQESLEKADAKIYSKNKYELVLREKR